MNAVLRENHPTEDRLDTLAARLRERIDGEVRFDRGSRALYATDGSIYRQVPLGVVLPRSNEDVVATVAACKDADVPLLSRGAGTSLGGQCCNAAVVMDFSKYMNRVLSIDAGARRARVQPGCVLDALRSQAGEHGLTFGPDPATHSHNTLGGMIGNNSCGVHSVMGGRTADNVESLDILTYDGLHLHVGRTPEDELEAIISEGGRRGAIYAGLRRLRDEYAERIRRNYPDIPRRVSGFNLDELLPENGFNVARALVGSEGTCMIVLEAELRLLPNPRQRCLLVLGYADVYRAADAVPAVLEHDPIGLEGIDDTLIDGMKKKHMHAANRALLPRGGGWLLVEFGGDTREQAAERARRLQQAVDEGEDTPSSKLFDDPVEEHELWAIRESALGATAHVPGEHETHPGWEDAAVPPAHLGDYLREFRALLQRYDYAASLYGHFGDGCVHCRIGYELKTEAGVAQWHAFLTEAADLVVRYGGSLSGEHGDGQARAELLGRMYGDALVDAFRRFKGLWDPRGRMNPGKVVDPYPALSNLRSGPDFDPPLIDSAFDYPDDRHSFATAVNRCVGIGQCRKQEGGVMCPSYRATQEERHSTRGRARLLFEMLKSGPIRGGFRSKDVHEALDLCLACKGCKRDCPVDVDMATYKAEFMSRHYRGRLRPRAAYSMGLIWWWSRIASRLPRIVNFLLGAPGIGALSKALAGIARQRRMPSYARQSFRAWFGAREPAATATTTTTAEVVLWPDTWNNHFQPEPLKAAVRVLEDAGYRVRIPEQALCCGRPLYAEGLLDQARRQLGAILDALNEPLRRGVPIVGLEPSCVASFRDELPQLFPADPRARALAKNSFLLSEFLDRCGYVPPRLHGKALVHTHCHHHASLDSDAERRLLDATGLDIQWLDSGCCGMAGSFGFRAESYELSLQIGELGPLPAVRTADSDTLIVTNGFSCREQLAQSASRESLNLSQLLDRALRERGRRLEPLDLQGETR